MNFLKSLFGSSPKKYQNVGPSKFTQLLEEAGKNAVLIDVRTPAEFAGGNVKGAVNIDIYSPSFGKEIDKLDKAKTYFLYCRSGNRSAQACRIMAERGFVKLYNLSGGIMSL